MHKQIINKPILTAACFAAFTAGAAASECAPTAADALGPFYVSGMPVLENINRFGKPGEELQLFGVVRSAAAGFLPVAGARVEIWQTDGGGNYYPSGSGDAGDYNDAELDLRGAAVSGEDGSFAFRTVVPGAYGAFFSRPKHFHYRITAPGYEELITQHYAHENGKTPGGTCRGAEIARGGETAVFRAPALFLTPSGE